VAAVRAALIFASATVLVLLAIAQTPDPAVDLVDTWYPHAPGDSWSYRNESLDGDMDHPVAESWTTVETVAGVEAVPELEATLITRRVEVMSENVTPGFPLPNDAARREPAETHTLIRRNCVYVLDGDDAEGPRCATAGRQCARPDRDDLQNGGIPADYCFPMSKGTSWGRAPDTSPADEFVWTVTGMNGDPFGVPGGRTFHFSAHAGSGETIDRWYAEGVGLVQEDEEHHGTYDESRRRLLSASIAGKTTSYELTPARTAPLSAFDCEGPGWKHYVRGNGSGFGSAADCVRYVRKAR
jgi:hypothetical protein